MESEYQTMIVDGQKMIVPTLQQWELIFENPVLEGKKIAAIDLVKQKVLFNSRYEEIKSCLGFCYDFVLFYELLRLEGIWVRVFIERVICEVCRKRADVSATPSVMDVYLGLEDMDQVSEKGYSFPNQKCKWCNSLYERRYTIWQKYED